MSFWPFGSTNSESEIDTIINNYLETLRSVEHFENISTTIVQRRHSSSHTIGHAGPSMITRSHSPVYSSHSIASDEDEIYGSPNHLHIADPKGIINMKERRSNRPSFSSLFKNNEMGKPFQPLPLGTLNNYYIDQIRKEPTLVDRLVRQDKKLMDFICFGYFYKQADKNEYEVEDEDIVVGGEDIWTKVYHIDYLIDVMLSCLDDIDGTYPFGSEDPPYSEDTEIENDDFIDPITKKSSSKNETQDSNFIKSGANDTLDRYTQLLRISDIITLNIPIVQKIILESSDRMQKLWSIIYHSKITSENSIQLTIFLKIQDGLLANARNSYLNFIRNKQSLVQDIFLHDDLPTIFDFLLRLICTDKPDDSTGIIDLLETQGLMTKCMNYFRDPMYSDRQKTSVCDFLKQLIGISVNILVNDISIGPNNLTRFLVLEETMETFIQILLEQENTILCNIVVLVIELIRKNNSDFDSTLLLETTILKDPPNKRDPLYLGHLLKVFTKHLPELLNIIWTMDAPDNKFFETQTGYKYKKIGLVRIKIIELIAELLHCSNMELMNSKTAELIAEERQSYRKSVTKEINCLLDGECTTGTLVEEQGPFTYNNSTVENDNLTTSDNTSESSFDKPFISMENNRKIRKMKTIGDAFKIMLFDYEVIPKILKIFLEHPWNNFWHNVTFDIIQQILNGRPDSTYGPFLLYSLFCLKDSRKYNLIGAQENNLSDFNILQDFILCAYKNSYQYYMKNSMTLGYSGHILLIAEDLTVFSNTFDTKGIAPMVFDRLMDEKWKTLSKDILAITKTMCIKILGGGERIEDQNGNITLQIYDNDRTTSTNENNEQQHNIEPDYPTQATLIDRIGTLF
ncbi:similar to Saccharomyces cerevisiae YGL229C SAP4 Protein required for function of the Sit4p protein phosphatase [Maudiozyma saulgeensis]|uniref:Similar to Saccharomyces cerevisiae YGL229C SAP4 Protein required for function of the Sit4p protein phosphatase n=1 Tax=Maudiozyma saulgeensis TaxID=1789683 RepID=A0A1X7QXB1_9SACH|nr:similar to Saccharomyces cerevisiae YGL229C SAP4 Protein required for function of the Sit4p protein phosphatase [Kazachstania saulgeensis]